MLKRTISLSITAALIALLSSCVGTNAVTNGHGIQKRKYTKGFYIEKGKTTFSTAEKSKSNTEILENEEEVAEWNTISEEKRDNPDVQKEELSKNPEVNKEEKEEVSKDLNGETTETSTLSQKQLQRMDASDQNLISRFKKVKAEVKQLNKRSAGGVHIIILVILALFLPPLAVALYEGITVRFWIDLVLFLVGLGLGFWLLAGLWWIAGLAAVIYALLIVLGVI
ncbi:MAG: YqaE/Pmp3 family membrane protein [Crocinitomicaceae bacterium]